MFLIAGVYNVIVGIMFIVLTAFFLPLAVSMFEVEEPPSLYFAHSFFVLVAIFGIGFYLVSIDIDKNHGIALMGVILKYLMVLVYIIYMVKGEIGVIGSIIIIADFIFGCLFLEFLINHKKL